MILVTGAAGNNGTEIVKGLANRQAQVRAIIRKASDGKGSLSRGVSAFAADFDDADSVRRALEGIERAFLVTASSEKVEEQQLRFVELAREAGTKHIVYLSQLHSTAHSPVRFLRYHAAVERAIAAAGIAYTNLRPNLYMQGLLLFKELIRSKGLIMAPVGKARVSVVDVRDIAMVAVIALTESGHENKTYDITGPESLTHADMAAQLSKALGKSIEFQDISSSAAREAFLGFHMPEWQADSLVEDYEHYKRGEAETVSDTVKEITGQCARSFRSFADDFKSAF